MLQQYWAVSTLTVFSDKLCGNAAEDVVMAPVNANAEGGAAAPGI